MAFLWLTVLIIPPPQGYCDKACLKAVLAFGAQSDALLLRGAVALQNVCLSV